MKKHNLALALTIILFCKNLNAQNNPLYDKTFEAYDSYASNVFGINFEMPEKFIDLNQYYVIDIIREGNYSGFLYGPIFKSKDEECIVMYPAFPRYIEDITMNLTTTINKDTATIDSQVRANNVFPRAQITSELKDATDLFDFSGKPLNDTINFNFSNHVTTTFGQKTKQMFNADTIHVYDIPLEKPYEEKYIHRTGMVVTKKDRGTLLFKFFFTEKGKEQEQKYLELLSQKVWYNEEFNHSDQKTY